MILAMAMLLAAAPQTQADLNRQTGADYRAADAALNAQYRRTLAAAQRQDRGWKPNDGGPSYAAALLAAQRAWIAFRDADCRLAGYQFRGGSAQGMAQGMCMTRLSRARTAELRQQERDLSPI